MDYQEDQDSRSDGEFNPGSSSLETHAKHHTIIKTYFNLIVCEAQDSLSLDNIFE